MISDRNVIILSDYGKGGLTHIARMIELARAQGKTVLVDPRATTTRDTSARPS